MPHMTHYTPPDLTPARDDWDTPHFMLARCATHVAQTLLEGGHNAQFLDGLMCYWALTAEKLESGHYHNYEAIPSDREVVLIFANSPLMADKLRSAMQLASDGNLSGMADKNMVAVFPADDADANLAAEYFNRLQSVCAGRFGTD